MAGGGANPKMACAQKLPPLSELVCYLSINNVSAWPSNVCALKFCPPPYLHRPPLT